MLSLTKKSKDKYINSIDKLPENAIYFTASNETKDLLVYGYVQPDVNSKLINVFCISFKNNRLSFNNPNVLR